LRPCTIDRTVDDNAAKTPGAQFLRLGRKAEERIDLAVDKQLLGANRAAGDPVDLRLGVDADIGGDQRQEQVLRRADRRDPDSLSGDLCDATDRVTDKQLEAADMRPGQHFDCGAAIDIDDLHRTEILVEIDHAPCDRVGLVDIWCEWHEADIGESFGAQ
jgi:hypothetical protein